MGQGLGHLPGIEEILHPPAVAKVEDKKPRRPRRKKGEPKKPRLKRKLVDVAELVGKPDEPRVMDGEGVADATGDGDA